MSRPSHLTPRKYREESRASARFPRIDSSLSAATAQQTPGVTGQEHAHSASLSRARRATDVPQDRDEKISRCLADAAFRWLHCAAAARQPPVLGMKEPGPRVHRPVLISLRSFFIGSGSKYSARSSHKIAGT